METHQTVVAFEIDRFFLSKVRYMQTYTSSFNIYQRIHENPNPNSFFSYQVHLKVLQYKQIITYL